jgi:hypothetical protein
VKLYVIVRKDIKHTSHRGVQGGHALAQLLLTYKKIKWKNGTLVYLAAKDEKHLKRLYKKMPCRKKAFFKEPYWDNSLTAISGFGKKLPHFLRKLPLL